jgi:hypothetical protein
MAKKPALPATPVVEEDPFIDESVELDPSDALGDLDFNVDDEFKPDPLIPKGTYHGVATKISYVPAQSCIVWDFCLHDNGGAMNDGETPIDGAHVFFRNWLPKPGDELEMTKNGRNNKRQSKINMMMDFQNAIGIDMSTPAKIATALSEQSWIGVEADLDVDVDEYQGRFRNTVNRAKKSQMY